MTGLPDVHHSRSVLIGISRYRFLGQLDAVHNNLSNLSKVLQDKQIWGLPPGNCVVVEDPLSATEALDPIAAAAHDATDTLLVYYAGHGLLTSDATSCTWLMLGRTQSECTPLFRMNKYATCFWTVMQCAKLSYLIAVIVVVLSGRWETSPRRSLPKP